MDRSIIVVDYVSTILINNQVRDIYYLRPTNSSFFPYYQTWIEGIGSLDELLIMAAPYVDYESELICFHENDSLHYFNINYTDCYYNTVGLHEYDVDGLISLSPNPTDGKFNIKFPEHFNSDNAVVSVTDILCIFRFKTDGTPDSTFSVNGRADSTMMQNSQSSYRIKYDAVTSRLNVTG